MESRYALREIEGAIGYDLRKLEDGRKAVFRHTWLHKRLKRDFFERRDVSMVMACAFVAKACLASRPGLDTASAYDMAEEGRKSMVYVMFPYIKSDSSSGESSEKTGKDSYDAYFDELEAILEKEKKLAGEAGNDIISDGK